jgi:hypothetical protein
MTEIIAVKGTSVACDERYAGKARRCKEEKGRPKYDADGTTIQQGKRALHSP